jgi:hypothetical protein
LGRYFRLPNCRSLKLWRIKGRGGARPGLFQCGEKRPCGKRFTVTVGIIFHRSHLPLTKWFLAIYLIAESSKPGSGPINGLPRLGRV